MKVYRAAVECEIHAEDATEAAAQLLRIVRPEHFHRVSIRDINGGVEHGDIVRVEEGPGLPPPPPVPA